MSVFVESLRALMTPAFATSPRDVSAFQNFSAGRREQEAIRSSSRVNYSCHQRQRGQIQATSTANYRRPLGLADLAT